jgi:antitoxin FitA
MLDSALSLITHYPMPQLLVRNIEEKVVRKLRERAAKAGVSVEEEHRRLLRETLLRREDNPSFKEHLLSIPQASADEPEDLFVRSRGLPREVDLE